MNQTITIFGSTGDLSARKLFPALYNMFSLGKLSYPIIAIGRKKLSHEEFVERIRPKVEAYARLSFDEAIFQDFSTHIQYVQMDLTQVEEYGQLNDFYKKHHYESHHFYLALSPKFFHDVIEGFKKIEGISKSQVVIEKPFGENTEDMRCIHQKLKEMFEEDQLYYIDHYLGKEMVQNIKTVRFQNMLFANHWNHEMIESIQISALEKDGILNRGGYYDKSGVLKDMVQNHIFQILSILTMDESQHQHEEQLKILKKLRINQILLGQYEGYLKEKDVEVNSQTPTYAELECRIDSPRWEGVPFYIRTGKKLDRREIYVIVKFKSVHGAPNNLLEIKIQPTEGIYFQFNIKKPGKKDQMQTAKMDFCQSCVEVNRINTPEAYERLLEEVFHHQREYFSTFDEILESSKIIENIEKPIPFIYGNKVEEHLTNWIEIERES